MVDSVSVRWVDLGTRLVLRHVVRVLGAEDNNSSNETDKDETNRDGEKAREEQQNAGPALRREQEEHTAGGKTRATEKPTGNVDREVGGNTERVMPTAEVDLSEIRWVESIESDERQSSSLAKQLIGEL